MSDDSLERPSADGDDGNDVLDSQRDDEADASDSRRDDEAQAEDGKPPSVFTSEPDDRATYRPGLKLTLLVVVAVTAAIAYATRPEVAGTDRMWWVLGVVYALLAVAAVHKMVGDGTLVDVLAPRWGDLSIGAVSALVLLFGSWAGRAVLAPSGSPEQAWIYHVYLAIGSAEAIQRSVGLTLAILTIAALEEVVWRGLVLGELSDRVGTRKAWPLAALLYTAALTPTLWTLSDPTAGLNPLPVLAAAGCGLVWSFLASITGRLPPAIVSHMAFTYFTAAQFRLPGLGG